MYILIILYSWATKIQFNWIIFSRNIEISQRMWILFIISFDVQLIAAISLNVISMSLIL